MSENVKDAVPQILTKIQDDIVAFRRDVTGRFDRTEDRLLQIETIQTQACRNLAAARLFAPPLEYGRFSS